MASPYFFLHQNTYNDLHLPAIIIAGCFVFVALVLSLLLTFQHLRWYTNPSEQKWIVAVVFMVPVYGTESILSLWNTKLSLACDILRNCYEAFALYAFGSYLIACLGKNGLVQIVLASKKFDDQYSTSLFFQMFILSIVTPKFIFILPSMIYISMILQKVQGGELEVINLLEDEARKQITKPLLEGKKDPQSQQKRFCNFIFRPCMLGKEFFTIIKFGLVQYMILKTLCAFLAFVLELCGVYGDGKFKWYYGYPYITIVLNFSQMWALYCLVQFYNVTHQRLEPIKPLAKFISFKAIVFATWWQGVGIVLLCTFGVLPKKGKFQTGLQDFLICIEMTIAAVAHIFVFSAKPYYFIPASQYGKVTTQETTAMPKVEEGGREEPALVEKRETKVEAPRPSVTESVQDIVVEGSQKVVKDVVLTINQAIEPVHEGMAKIQETFHQISVYSDSKDEPEVKVKEHEQSISREPKV